MKGYKGALKKQQAVITTHLLSRYAALEGDVVERIGAFIPARRQRKNKCPHHQPGRQYQDA